MVDYDKYGWVRVTNSCSPIPTVTHRNQSKFKNNGYIVAMTGSQWTSALRIAVVRVATKGRISYTRWGFWGTSFKHPRAKTLRCSGYTPDTLSSTGRGNAYIYKTRELKAYQPYRRLAFWTGVAALPHTSSVCATCSGPSVDYRRSDSLSFLSFSFSLPPGPLH